jgi:HSP20 family protein
VLRDDFDKLFSELRGWGGEPRERQGERGTQTVPVNVFETENELMIVAAMPGIEAGNVDIRVEENRLTIRSEKRGPGQEHHRYLVREWSYGPYERTIELPRGVDIDKANATYSNGIVTIALPKSTASRTRRIEISLDQTGTSEGEHVGHRGTAEAGGGQQTGPKGVPVSSR